MISVLQNQRIPKKSRRGLKASQGGSLFTISNLKNLFIIASIGLMVLYLFTSGRMLPLLARSDSVRTTPVEWDAARVSSSIRSSRAEGSTALSEGAVQSAQAPLKANLSALRETSTVSFTKKVPARYKIEQGETLYEIAERFDLSVFDLILLNQIQDPTKVRAGRILQLVDRDTASLNLTSGRTVRLAGIGISKEIVGLNSSADTAEIPFPTNIRLSANKTTGMNPLKVTFSLQTPLEEGTYMWDLGDWVFAFSRNPTYTFDKPGLYNVKLRIRSGGNMTISDKSVTVRVLPRRSKQSYQKFITLSHPKDVLNLDAVLPAEIMTNSISNLNVSQRPVLFKNEGNYRYVAKNGGYAKITVTKDGQSHSLFTFVSPYPSVHAKERDFDWYKTQFGTGILGNCGPATVAMASYWATEINTSVASIRSEIGMPFSSGAVDFEHMVKPLRQRGVQFLLRSVSSEKDIMNVIDRGNIGILLIHTSHIERTRGNRVENIVGRYYTDSVGHYIIVKGYTLDKRYFIVYDPIPSDWNSNSTRYADGVSMLGKNRYYPVKQVIRAMRQGEMFEIYPN
jgi:PKD repeat protein